MNIQYIKFTLNEIQDKIANEPSGGELAKLFHTIYADNLSNPAVMLKTFIDMNVVDVGFMALNLDTGTPVGYLLGHEGTIRQVIVVQEYRRKGIGTQLINEFKKSIINKHAELTVRYGGLFLHNYKFSSLDLLDVFFSRAGFKIAISGDYRHGDIRYMTGHIDLAMSYHEEQLEKIEENAYIKFLKSENEPSCVSLDGRYTIEELETILFMARKRFS